MGWRWLFIQRISLLFRKGPFVNWFLPYDVDVNPYTCTGIVVTFCGISFAILDYVIWSAKTSWKIAKNFEFCTQPFPSIIISGSVYMFRVRKYIYLLQSRDTTGLSHWGPVTLYGDLKNWVKIGSVSGLLPGGTKPVHEPMLTYPYHQRCSVAFTIFSVDELYRRLMSQRPVVTP